MDGAGSLSKLVLGAAVASTVLSLPWLYSKIAPNRRDELAERPLSHSTSAIPSISSGEHPPRDTLFYSGSIIPPSLSDSDALVKPVESEEAKKISEEDIRSRVAKAIEEERTRTQQLLEVTLKHETKKFEQLLVEERERYQRQQQEEAERIRREEKQAHQQQLERALRDKDQIIENLTKENSEKEELIQAARNEMVKVRHQLELLEKDIQNQQSEQQEQQTQREIAEVKLHEEDIKYQKALEDIKRLNEERDAYQSKTAELQDRLSGLKEELEQAYQQIQSLSLQLDQPNSAIKEENKKATETTIPEKSQQQPESVSPPVKEPEIVATDEKEKAKSPRVIVVKRPTSTVSSPVISGRLAVVNELLKTEISYVNQLRLIVELFIHPLEEVCAKHSTQILTKEEIESIFSHIPTIYCHNKQLASTLEEKIKDWNEEKTTIGDIFMKIGTLLGYEEYCYHYAKSIENLNNLLASNAAFAEFVEMCYQRPELGKLTLLDLMITPIQRMPRYALLLSEILKKTSSNHPDFALLQEAIQKVKEQTERMNDFEKTADNLNKISEVQRRLTGAKKAKWTNLVTPGRRYIKEGDLTIFETGKAKQWLKQKRYFFLFSDLVLETKPLSKAKSKLVTNKLFKSVEGAKNEKYKYKRGFAVEAIESVTDTSDPTTEKFTFQLKTSVGICFEAKVDASKTPDAEQIKNEWIVAFKSVMNS
eukprot:TRINITY_DN9696_c0_g1_i1.p1 TRINITY_DN9696_c0_g1~~TRINITY_DN9696_c0_g1_i1.p1  ORF type:complete len:707 (+),score=198.32 TRINITY_DN9696_c0_g1_i1:133-2253(+)